MMLCKYSRKPSISRKFSTEEGSPLKLPTLSNLGDVQHTASTLFTTCTSNINQRTFIKSSKGPASLCPEPNNSSTLVCPDSFRPTGPRNYGACHSNPPIICRVESV